MSRKWASMGARSKWTLGLLTTILAAALLYMAQPDPIVRAAVGSHLGAVQEASSYGFDFEDMDDNLPLVVESTVVFEYAANAVEGPTGDALGFTLPPGRFVWIDQEAARVYQITVSPQLESLPLEETYERCEEIIEAVADAPGWRRVGEPTPSVDVLREYYASDPVNRHARLAEWRAGGVKLTLGIKRSAEADREYSEGYPEWAKATEDRFIIDVDASDFDLSDKYFRLVNARRRAAGDVEEPLPIQVWLDDPDWSPDSGRQP